MLGQTGVLLAARQLAVMLIQVMTKQNRILMQVKEKLLIMCSNLLTLAFGMSRHCNVSWSPNERPVETCRDVRSSHKTKYASTGWQARVCQRPNNN